MSVKELVSFYPGLRRQGVHQRTAGTSAGSRGYDNGRAAGQAPRRNSALATLEPEPSAVPAPGGHAQPDHRFGLADPHQPVGEVQRQEPQGLQSAAFRSGRLSAPARPRPSIFRPRSSPGTRTTRPSSSSSWTAAPPAYNNPAFLAYRMLVEPAVQARVAEGEGDLLIVSVGTGAAPTSGRTVDDPEQNLAATAKQHARRVDESGGVRPGRQLPDCSAAASPVLTSIARWATWFRATPMGKRDCADHVPGACVPLRALRCALDEGLDHSLQCGDIDPVHVSMLDSVEYMKELDRVGCAVGALVDVDKFGPLLDN